MDGNRQRAYEDIACIRDILARTAADFKGLASFFIAMGLIWCVDAVLSIGASVVVRVIPALQVQMLRKGILDERMADQRTILYGSMFVERCLNLVFPVLPILLTSVFLENRAMKALGLAVAVLVLLWIFVPGTSVSLGESVPAELLQEMLWKKGLVTVIQIIPAAALLAFGLNLKKT